MYLTCITHHDHHICFSWMIECPLQSLESEIEYDKQLTRSSSNPTAIVPSRAR